MAPHEVGECGLTAGKGKGGKLSIAKRVPIHVIPRAR